MFSAIHELFLSYFDQADPHHHCPDFGLTAAGWVYLIATRVCSALEPISGFSWKFPTSTGSRLETKMSLWLITCTSTSLARKRKHTAPFLSYFRTGRSGRKFFLHFCAFTFPQALAEGLHTKESRPESQFSLLRQVRVAHTSASHLT